ncbi:hypothetical protein BDZ89DRAFT_1098171 [Hymenopellis radicata]|nr:hypothetical protein BDZ89DRAFT_1098171 [Hymenopellis radicata]
MSKLTATQVIAQGSYLEPDFEPSSLTVSQLLGVLSHHAVKYPTPYSKPKLVQVFNDEIKANSAKLKRQRLKHESSIASDDGITDGVTGKPISVDSRPAAARRTSRRLSRAPAQDSEPEPHPDPPKRRRSSAQPTFGAPSKPINTQPTLAEESEPEEEDLPVRKVVKTKKNASTAGASSRRVSHAEDSGWEDNNIFQSGAESSSPARPSPVRPKSRRPSVRNSPQTSPPSSPNRIFPTGDRLPQSRFEPHLPLLPTPRSPFTVQPKEPDVAPSEDDPLFVQEEDVKEYIVDEAEAQEAFATTDNLSEGGGSEQALVEDTSLPWILRVFIWLSITGALFVAGSYKMESAPIGYCDAGSDTNSVLEDLRASRQAIELCNTENRTTLRDGDDTPCPLPTFIPALHPDTCTPCPEHATCTRETVTCDTGYILRPHPLFFFLPPVPSPTNVDLSTSSPPNELAWKLISELTNGLPGLGSVGLPPSCVEDPKRKRHIGALGKAVERILADKRGEILCAGGDTTSVSEAEGGEAKKWGMELDELRSAMRSMTAAHLLHTFDDMFNEAIQQLLQWGGIILGENSSGDRYIAHKTPHLTLSCTAIVKSRGIWRAWRLTLLGMVISAIAVSALRARNARNKEEMKRVAELVPVALKTVRDAEMAHYTDPITSPQPFVSSVQLRDLLLPHESLAVRDSLWIKVARIVEANTNVRANLEEGNGGNEMRVWRWVGGGSGGQKQLAPDAEKTEDLDGL